MARTATTRRTPNPTERAEDDGDASLRDVEVTDADDDGLAVGSGGAVYDLTDGEWVRQATPTGQNLKAVVRGDVDVAVGAGGTIVER